MSQPHPPIPAPQPHPQGASDDDDPRTQSILLPPSQRQTTPPEDAARVDPQPGHQLPAQPAPVPPGTAQFPAVGPDQAPPAQHTGPAHFVPGFGERPPAGPSGSSSATAPPPPGPGAPPAPASDTSTGTHRRSPVGGVQRAGRGRAALLAVGLAALGLVLLELGLALDYGNQSLWEVVPAWSAFATVAGLVVLLAPLAAMTGRLPARTAWRAGAVGLAGLTAAWVLVALPLAASDRGFWLTAALAAAGAALWLTPGRTE